MPDAGTENALQALVTKTAALDDDARAKILAVLPRLNDAQKKKLTDIIAEADTKLVAINQETQKAIEAENRRYAQALKEFRLKTIPHALKIAEQEHRGKEDALSEELLKKAADL